MAVSLFLWAIRLVFLRSPGVLWLGSLLKKPCSSSMLLSAVISLKPRLFTHLHSLMWNGFWHIACRCPALFPSSCMLLILLGIMGKQRDQGGIELNIDVYVSTSPLSEYGQRCWSVNKPNKSIKLDVGPCLRRPLCGEWAGRNLWLACAGSFFLFIEN